MPDSRKNPLAMSSRCASDLIASVYRNHVRTLLLHTHWNHAREEYLIYEDGSDEVLEAHETQHMAERLADMYLDGFREGYDRGYDAAITELRTYALEQKHGAAEQTQTDVPGV
jgi:hypothetical protein